MRTPQVDAATPDEPFGDVKRTFLVEGHALRSAEAFIELRDLGIDVDTVNRIDRGQARRRDEEIALAVEHHVIGGN